MCAQGPKLRQCAFGSKGGLNKAFSAGERDNGKEIPKFTGRFTVIHLKTI